MSYKILVVDDSRLARMAAGKALSDLYPGWTRLEAANADDAIRIAPQADLALLDFNMPGRDGLALAEQLRDARPAMPLAIVSANSQREIVDRAQALDVTFLAKPLMEDALREFLGSAVQRLEAASR